METLLSNAPIHHHHEMIVLSTDGRTMEHQTPPYGSNKKNKNQKYHQLSTTINPTFDLSEHETHFLENLSNLRLIGHLEQKKALKQAFDRVKLGGMSEVVFLHGESGVGKSKTASDVFRKETKVRSKKKRNKKKSDKNKVADDNTKNERGRGHFVTGKFDQIQSHTDPYSAIVSAFSDICEMIEHSKDSNNQKQVRDNLIDCLSDDEAVTLLKLIPSLIRLIGLQETAFVDAIGTTSLLQAFVKFKLLCRKFLCAVATEMQPIILLLDDMQWADEGSMEIFKSLCSDLDSKHVLIVAAYRDDDGFVPPNQEAILPSTDVPVPRLNVEDVNTMVATLTGMSPEESLPLGVVVHSKTQGNAQFCKLFLESVFKQGLLVFSHTEHKWVYDIEKVRSDTNNASNVLVAAKISRLGSDVQDVLKFASCLGFVFELEHLQVVLVSEYRGFTNKTRLPGATTSTSTVESHLTAVKYRGMLLKLMDKAVKDGILVEGKRSGTFSFSHDRVFETVYATLPTGLERQQLHVRIGRLLLDSFPQNDVVAFLAVDHLNQGSGSIGASSSERLQLAQLNRSMAKQAITKFSAFDRARAFIISGLALFPGDDLWRVDYEMALDMHTIGAQSSVGGESPQMFVDNGILNAKTLLDKIPLYMILMKFYGWENRFEEAVEVGLSVLKSLGEKMPHNAGKTHVAWEFVLAKRAVGNRSDEEILSLPQVKDSRKIAIMKTLTELQNHAYYTNPTLMISCIIRGLRLTIRYGVYSELTAVAVASYGSLHLLLNKEKESLRFLNLSLELLKRQKSQYSVAACFVTVYGLGLHRWEPLENMYNPLVAGYEAGEKYGDTNHGLSCALLSAELKLLVGAPLGEVEKMLDGYIHLAKAYNKIGLLALATPLHQRVLNLMGHNKEPTVLTGTAMNQDKLLCELELCNNDVSFVNVLNHVFQVTCFFEEWEKAFRYYQQIQKYQEALKTLDTTFAARQFQFFFGLFCSVWHQKTGCRKHKKSAHRILSSMKLQQETGCPNYDCFIPILNAQLLSYKASKDVVHAAFWRAVDSCKYAHLRGLAHERAAAIIQNSYNDRTLSREHLQAAKRQYTQWQAHAKVRDVDQKLKYL